MRIGGELRDRYGQKLGRPFAVAKQFDDHFPTVEIGVQGDYFEPAASRPVPVASVNVDDYELVTASLTREQVMSLYAFDKDEERFEALRKLGNAKTERIEPKAALNQISERPIAPAAVLGGAARRGPLAIGVRYTKTQPGASVKGGAPGVSSELASAVRIVQVTDLAISAKLSRHGSLVWVSRLSNGQPAASRSRAASTQARAPALHDRRAGHGDDPGA